jgi:hypothetical protein
MNLAGVSINQFLKIGITAVLFIILFKYLAAKSGIGGLQAVAGQV